MSESQEAAGAAEDAPVGQPMGMEDQETLIGDHKTLGNVEVMEKT